MPSRPIWRRWNVRGAGTKASTLVPRRKSPTDVTEWEERRWRDWKSMLTNTRTSAWSDATASFRLPSTRREAACYGVISPTGDLGYAFTDIGSDPDNKVVIMTGAGEDFCAGWGGPFPVRKGPREWDPVYWEGKRLLINLLDIEVPMISAVNGPATFHAEIPALSDIVLASENAVFQDEPHFLRGSVPGDGVHVVWPC